MWLRAGFRGLKPTGYNVSVRPLEVMVFLYALSALILIQVTLGVADAVRSARYMRTDADTSGQSFDAAATGRVAVFCPCKGLDHEFETNMRSILRQDFANFAVYFILESEADPAYAVLKKLGAGNILIAGESKDCGQKVHNLRYAVERAGRDADIYAFCDSDVRYPAGWLARLTAPLAGGEAAVATGYRWYAADRFHIPTLLRSAWNSTALGMLGGHNRNFAWGGSTAVRREVFERIGVLDAWRGALSDDYAITRAAHAAGVKIRFVPDCLVPSHGECRFRELLEFTTRQIVITRVYHPKLWRTGFATQTVFNIAFWSLFGAAVYTRTASLAVLWAAIYALSAARSAIRVSAVQSRLRDPALSRYAWFYAVASPAIALLYEYNMAAAAFTNEIEWRQIHYTLISPNETRRRASRAPSLS